MEVRLHFSISVWGDCHLLAGTNNCNSLPSLSTMSIWWSSGGKHIYLSTCYSKYFHLLPLYPWIPLHFTVLLICTCNVYVTARVTQFRLWIQHSFHFKTNDLSTFKWFPTCLACDPLWKEKKKLSYTHPGTFPQESIACCSSIDYWDWWLHIRIPSKWGTFSTDFIPYDFAKTLGVSQLPL